MTKLNQVIAVEKGIKARTHSALSDVYKAVQKPELFNGFAKHYLKKDDEAEDLPSEKKIVQLTAKQAISTVKVAMAELFDITAAKDWTNCKAKGTVELDGIKLIEHAPVSFLLFLEKQLTDIRTFVDSIPVLDVAENWTLDQNSSLYKTEESRTHRTKKTVKPIVLYHATPEHPAQTQLITEDAIVGFWAQVKQSGAIPRPEKEQIVAKADKLIKAVKEAREAANNVDVAETPNTSNAIFSYLFGG